VLQISFVSIVGDNVKQLAAEKAIPMQRLAKQAGVTRSSIYKVIADEMDPSPEWIEKIAKVLGVTASQLVATPESDPLWRVFQEHATAHLGEGKMISFRATYYDVERLRLIAERKRIGKLKPFSESATIRSLIKKAADDLDIVVPILKPPK
jgi:transcriptional regulator with XRE-family HTH domain